MKKIAVLGTGRMGSWLARELSGDHMVAVFDEDRTKTAALTGVAKLDALSGLKEFTPDLLINAVPLDETVRAFMASEQYLSEGCVLADVASIKQGLSDYYSRCPFRFVSTHPMFGPTFADMASPEGEWAVIIKESDPEGTRFFTDFFTKRGIRVVEYGMSDHDRVMARSLTIPFVSSMAFAACLEEKTVPGTTYRKHRDIAGRLLDEDDRLLTEILFNSYSVVEIDRITARLEFLKHIIKARDYEEAGAFLNALRKNLGGQER
jgi:prephenate dehydrogenase